MRKNPSKELQFEILRGSIRLVHCLQKERGVSCVYSASCGGEALSDGGLLNQSKSSHSIPGNSSNEDLTLHNMSQNGTKTKISSKNTDAPKSQSRIMTRVSSLDKSMNKKGIVSSTFPQNVNSASDTISYSHRIILGKCRKATDAAVFSLVNIVSKVHPSVWNEDQGDMRLFLEEIDSDLSKGRSKTDEAKRKHGGMGRSNEKPIENLVSTFDSFSSLLHQLIVFITTLITSEGLEAKSKHSKVDNNENLSLSNSSSTSSQPQRRTRTLSCSISDAFNSLEVTDEYSALLSLLIVFLQKKERTGHERALLLGLKSLPAETVKSVIDISSIFNRLIMGAEAEKRLAIMLKSCSQKIKRGIYKPISLLIHESLNLPKEMVDLIDNLHSHFDLKQLRETKSIAEISDIWTLYMDRLHATELLILEEVESEMTLIGDGSDGSLNQEDKSFTSSVSFNSFSHFGDKLTRSHHSLRSMSSLRSRVSIVATEDDDTNLLDSSFNKVKTSKSSYSYKIKASETTFDQILIESKENSGNSQKSDNTLIDDGWNIPLSEVKFLKKVGAGAASTNYLAIWQGEKVCVKVASVTKLGLEGWRTEVASLQRIHHPNIIRLLGTIYSTEPLSCCLVLDYCNLGDLGVILDDRKKYPSLPRDCFIRVAEDIASGMTYLHSRNVLHRDIKPQNLLLSGDFEAGRYSVRLTDFGVAKFSTFRSISTSSQDMEETELTAETGTYRYMAPEVIRHEHYSFEADVYSYAVVLWQVFTRREPFFEVDSIAAAKLVAIDCVRPPITDDIPKVASDIIKRCWIDPPSSRPSFKEICSDLMELRPIFGG